MSNGDFLPQAYEIPTDPGQYLNPSKITGEVKFRILGSFADGSAIMGYEYWKDMPDGSRKPIRKRMNEEIQTADLGDNGEVKHFWAFPVYNQTYKVIQIMEITQKSLMTEIELKSKDPDWGNPRGYDFKLSKTGTGIETRYTITTVPHSPLSPAIMKAVKDTPINIEAMWTSNDPFEVKTSHSSASNQVVDPNDIPDDIPFK